MSDERIVHARVVQGEEEINAVNEVLRRPQGLRLGVNVAEMERRVAALSGKRWGVMCNSGSSAILLAISMLDLPDGSEVITSPLTFSTDVGAIIKSRLVPVFVDVEADTFNVDANRIEAMVGERTSAILLPNLAGNAPDWAAVRDIADRHGLKVIEDGCDTLGATLAGNPTGSYADVSATSFAIAHVITCAGTGGMVMVDDEELRDRGLLSRRWGRRSELYEFGSRRDEGAPGRQEIDGISYDADFIFETLPWNLEPSELGAAYGLAQLDRLDDNYARCQRNTGRYTALLEKFPEYFTPPRELEGLETAWLRYPFLINERAGFTRAALQDHLDDRGIDTRPVWSGNITRHPMMKDVPFRVPSSGLPNADFVMSNGLTVPCSQGVTEREVEYVCEELARFVGSR